MSDLAVSQLLPPMTAAGMDRMFALEATIKEMPQVTYATKHVIHAGIYSRTICIKAGVAVVGVRIKVPSQLVVSGHCVISHGDSSVECNGYDVIAAPAGRKTAVLAYTDTYVTMMFGTDAATVEEAERQGTDDYESLSSHRDEYDNIIVITGELPCLGPEQQQLS